MKINYLATGMPNAQDTSEREAAMKLEMKTLMASIVAGTLAGCASGGGSSGSDVNPPNIDTREEAVVCMLLWFICPFMGDLATPAEPDSQDESAASLTSSRQLSSFSTWSGLRRGVVTGTSNNLIGEAHYAISAEGAIGVQRLETSDGKYGEVQYDWAGKPVHFASGVYRSRGGRTLSDLGAAGQSWADVAFSAGAPGSAQTPFTSRPAGEIELAANPYTLGWNYQSFGVWDSAVLGFSRQFGGTSFGSATPASAVPVSGSATFTGKLGGLYVSPAGQGALATADIRVDANFSSRSLSFASSGTSITRDLATAATAPNLNVGGTLTYSPSSNSFTGTLRNAGGTMSGSSTGRYYGPAAQELGGVFTLKSATTPEAFSGAYGAKR
jgi:hypothetical protein